MHRIIMMIFVIKAMAYHPYKIKEDGHDLELHYYPVDFIDLITSPSASGEKILDRLNEVYRYKHNRVEGKHDIVHKSCLINHKCYWHFNEISYSQAREILFGHIDLREGLNGHYVKDRYCEEDYTSSIGVGPWRVPSHQYINTEHTWPQSRFSKYESKGMQKSDLHHLYPTNSRANSVRGSDRFAEVEASGLNDCEASASGRALNGRYTGFEPPDEHKGNVARALFYFSTRYGTKISSEEEEYLRKWHEMDPVDLDEKNRNKIIFKFQGVRNPFIDFPFLVQMIADF